MRPASFRFPLLLDTTAGRFEPESADGPNRLEGCFWFRFSRFCSFVQEQSKIGGGWHQHLLPPNEPRAAQPQAAEPGPFPELPTQLGVQHFPARLVETGEIDTKIDQALGAQSPIECRWVWRKERTQVMVVTLRVWPTVSGERAS